MGTPINQRQLRNDSAEVLRRAEAGEVFTVTRRGVPVADLGPHRLTGGTTTTFVSLARLAASAQGLPAWDVAAWWREVAALEDVLGDDDDDDDVDGDSWSRV